MRLVIHRLTVIPSGYPDTLDGIKRFFLETYGWRNVYHFLVWPDRVEQWASLDVRGSHAAPHNTGSWGIAIIGDWRSSSPCAMQWDRAVDVAARLHWMDSTWPHTWLYRNGYAYRRCSGHGELPGITKNCPGGFFSMGQFRADVRISLVELRRNLDYVSPYQRSGVFGYE